METTFGAVELVKVEATVREYHLRVVAVADVGVGRLRSCTKKADRRAMLTLITFEMGDAFIIIWFVS